MMRYAMSGCDYLFTGSAILQQYTRLGKQTHPINFLIALDPSLPVHQSAWTCNTTLPGAYLRFSFLRSHCQTSSNLHVHFPGTIADRAEGFQWLYHHPTRTIHLFREGEPRTTIDQDTGKSIMTTDASHHTWQCNHSLTSTLKNDWLVSGTYYSPPSPLTVANGRKDHSLVSFGPMIILIGGYNMYDRKLATCEAYNTDTRKWSALPSLNYARSLAHAVVINGQITVIGGNYNVRAADSIEVLNRKTKSGHHCISHNWIRVVCNSRCVR
jgi:hypothetical protein